tara:strand:- start:948 stop:1658 length:711 start_codon:yes stop_codon:yes gene_type:complete
LGPFWLFIQPLLTTIVFSVIFGNIANISTNDLPPNLFYMSGIVAWNYFATCLSSTSTSFISNSGLFAKVYFPRIILPLGKVMSGLLRFFIQFMLFLGFYLYYIFAGNQTIQPAYNLFIIFPILILQMAILGLGIGLIISSMTIKYRDLKYLVSFGTQLLMYLSPIIYPLSSVPNKYKFIIMCNPMTPVIEAFRFLFLGQGELVIEMYFYSILVSILTFIVGLMLFNKVEKNFIDLV